MYSDSYRTTPKSSGTPQTQPIPGRETEMVANSAGGFVFPVDDWKRLERFLILGAEGGTFYVGKKELVRDNAKAVERCIAADGVRAVKTIVSISLLGRAPKNEPALFALAMCMKLGDAETRAAAAEAMPRVVRIGTHLFHFAEYVQAFGGWGRSTCRAFSNWYLNAEPGRLAYQLVKYQQRDGWSHRDVLRKAHPKAKDPVHNALINWAIKRDSSVLEAVPSDVRVILDAFEAAKRAETPAEIVSLIERAGLPREAIPTQFLKDNSVWEALLMARQGMPLTAMIRNLGKMTAEGVLASPFSTLASAFSKAGASASKADTVTFVCNRLRDAEAMRRSRIHPIAVLSAMKVYSQGHGIRGSLTWTPVPQIVDALNDAFYASFDAVEATGKRRLIALDVSGSMGADVLSTSTLSCREASAALAMVTARTESLYHVIGFTGAGSGYGGYGKSVTGHNGCSSLNIGPNQRLDAVVRTVSGLPFGSTDCALPMLYAAQEGFDVDAIEIYTDNETYAGTPHPTQALKDYRNKVGHPVKLIVNGMTSTGFTIADPTDAHQLDVVGFDTATPAVMADFLRD